MYKSFEIRNFRCFPRLTLAHLERINLIAGVNNIGKTALLEALFLHCGAYNPELTLRLNTFRGIDTVKVERGRWTENTPGALEDLCLQSVTQDPAMLCVGVYFQCLQKQGLPMPSNLPKARVQAFLASRQEAGKRLGEAAQAGYLPWDDKAFEPVRNFLQQLGS